MVLEQRRMPPALVRALRKARVVLHSSNGSEIIFDAVAGAEPGARPEGQYVLVPVAHDAPYRALAVAEVERQVREDVERASQWLASPVGRMAAAAGAAGPATVKATGGAGTALVDVASLLLYFASRS